MAGFGRFGCGIMMSRRKKGVVHYGVKETEQQWGDLSERAKEYIMRCYSCGDGVKNGGRFPNMAGFCRFLGVGVENFRLSMKERQEEYDTLCAMFEDEALNSGLSATLISAYLKRHLGYGEKPDSGGKSSCELDQIKLVFEHDIDEDGQ